MSVIISVSYCIRIALQTCNQEFDTVLTTDTQSPRGRRHEGPAWRISETIRQIREENLFKSTVDDSSCDLRLFWNPRSTHHLQGARRVATGA